MEEHQSSKHLVDKFVRLHCVGSRVFEGFVYTVDPVSRNFVLFPSEDTDFRPVIVRHDAILKVETLDHRIPDKLKNYLDSLFTEHDVSIVLDENTANSTTKHASLSEEELKSRRAKLMALFVSNHIDVVLNDNQTFSINNVVFVEPPYTIDSISGSNVVVLDRIRKLLADVIS